MPVNNLGFDIFNVISASFGVKVFLILFLVFYTVFALMLFRQIQIMNKKLPTPISPILKFVGILHLGVALAVLLVVIGSF